MRKYIYILSTFLLLSCFNQNSKIKKVEKSTAEDIEVEIVKTDSSYLNSNLIIQNSNLNEKFSEYELKEFKNKNISPNEVLKLINKSLLSNILLKFSSGLILQRASSA